MYRIKLKQTLAIATVEEGKLIFTGVLMPTEETVGKNVAIQRKNKD